MIKLINLNYKTTNTTIVKVIFHHDIHAVIQSYLLSILNFYYLSFDSGHFVLSRIGDVDVRFGWLLGSVTKLN